MHLQSASGTFSGRIILIILEQKTLFSARSERMHFVLSAVLPLLILSLGECASVNNTQSRIGLPNPTMIKVNNGQKWGTWGIVERCIPGTYAKGFSLKVSTF